MLVKGLERYCKIVDGKESPKYLLAKESGLLAKKVAKAKEILQNCHFCERNCRVNRLKGEKGFCQADASAKVFGAHAHFGEEPELVPSATLFFAGCDMRCSYCQNAPESVTPSLGDEWSEERIAHWIEEMQSQNCKNVNFVGGDPTPYTFNILKALSLTNASLPVVWNSNSYYSEETAKLLEEIVDVYLLDFRYFSNKCSVKYSSAPRYVETAKRNFLQAFKDSELLIRVLVIPSHIECCAKPIVKWFAENLSLNVRLNLLDQYYPTYKAFEFPEIARRLNREEFLEVKNYAIELGLTNLV